MGHQPAISKIAHHPVFSEFVPYCGDVPQGFQVDFIGALMCCDFIHGAGAYPSKIETSYPPIDEEYFEWIDILESVRRAQGQYVMFELGAGYGRWAVRAACALKNRAAIPIHLVAVEAEPTHFRWLREHFRNNGLDPEAHALIQGVVSDKSGDSLFLVGMPGGRNDRADQWYGQAVAASPESPTHRKRIFAKYARSLASWIRGRGCRSSEEQYEGLPVFRDQSGWKSIKVRSLTLEALLGDFERVDLIDFDLQGEELKVIQSSLDSLDSKVARLHIGTHARDIEKGLRISLAEHGWNCLADYPCGATSQTPWGTVNFQDGVQSWVNPRLETVG